jgi:hypothetical protein
MGNPCVSLGNGSKTFVKYQPGENVGAENPIVLGCRIHPTGNLPKFD